MNVRDQRTMAAISRGSREAFVGLFDRTSGPIRAELASCLPGGDHAALVAATYVEVWWLAGCHSGPERDAEEWIKRILHRRIAEVERSAKRRSRRPPAASDPVDRRPSRAELELAVLLGRPVRRMRPG